MAERLVGIQCVREALRAQRRKLVRLAVHPGRQSRSVAELVSLAKQRGVPVVEREIQEPQDRQASGNPQGVQLEASSLPELSLVELLARVAKSPEPRKLIVALDGVEDPQNVGAIARVCEVAGVAGLVLTHRRAPPLTSALARASAGAIEWLPIARVPNLGKALGELRSAGFWSLGADLEGSDSLYQLDKRLASADLVVVLGAEGRGLRPGVVKQLDTRVQIPTVGHVESLNVSTAGAVLLFELQRRLAETAPLLAAQARRGTKLA